MRYGIVSDIHANIQAWNAVLRDMHNEGVDTILCLGDVVGYGPNPAEVLDSCYEHVDYFILGNHDAVIGNRLDSELFNDNAKYLIEWTRSQLNDEAADFFADMPLRMQGDDLVCAHAELAMPGRFSYIYEARDAIESFTSNKSPLMFVGHTHFPAKFRFDLSTNLVHKELCTNGYVMPSERYLINVGSVGDPRDGNTTASYCIYDAENNYLSYRQIPFDLEKFRSNLLKAKLPIKPFFLNVYDGGAKEDETIKDMEVMADNQVERVHDAVHRIDKQNDTKTSRKKVTFSMDDVRSSRQTKEYNAQKRQSEKEVKKKGAKVLMALSIVILCTFAGVFTWLKLQQPVKDERKKLIDKVDSEPEKQVIVQKDAEDLLLSLKTMHRQEGLVIENNELRKWNSEEQKLSWTVRLNHKGWYKVYIDHNKAEGKAALEFRLGPTLFSGELGVSDGEQQVALFENLNAGQMDFSISLAKSSELDVSILKSVKLVLAGDEKPFDFAREDIVLGDFESGTYNGWITVSWVYGHKPMSEADLPKGIEIDGIRGKYFAASLALGSSSRGKMRSPTFEINHKYLAVVAAGGDACSINLYVDSKLVESHQFTKLSSLKKIFFNLKQHTGKSAFIEFVDDGSSYIVFDNVTLLSNEPHKYVPGSKITVKGAKQKVSVNELNKFLTKAGEKLLRLDFKNCLRDLEEGALVTDTNLNRYINSVEAIMDLEKLFISSFEKDLNKKTTIKPKGTGVSKTVTVKAVKDKSVQVLVDGSNSITSLGMIHMSDEGILERLEQIPKGKIAYLIHNKKITEESENIEYSSTSAIGTLIDAALGRLTITYPKRAIVGSQVEIWAMMKSEKAVWDLKVSTSDGDREFDKAKIVNIEDVYPNYKVKGLTRKSFKVYKYDLKRELHIRSIAFENTRGDAQQLFVIVRNSQGKIVWQKSFNENISTKPNLLKSRPIRFDKDNSQPLWENLALGKTASTNTPHSSGYVGVNDGIWSYSPPFLFGSSKKEEFPKFVTIDLEKEEILNTLRFGIPNRGSTKNISIQYSLNNNEYKTIFDFDFIQGLTDRYTAHFESIKARYIRVRFNENYEKTLNRADNSHVFLTELEAYYLE